MRSLSKIFLTVAASVLSSVAYFNFSGVKCDIVSLLGGDKVLSALAKKNSSRIRVLCMDEESADACRKIIEFDEGIDYKRIGESLIKKSRGILGEKAREELRRGEIDKLKRRVLRRDYSGVGMFSKEEDPWYFLNDFIMEIKPDVSAEMPEGALILEKETSEDDYPRLLELKKLAEKSDKIFLSGANFHTAAAYTSSKSEISFLSVVSLIVVVLLGFRLFKSPRFIIPLSIAIGFGLLSASVAVFSLFAEPHILTFVFGTSLIGLGVDYCFHYQAHDIDDKKELLKSMLKALCSTVLAFLPLMFSSVDILREMAVFTMSGLLGVFVCVISTPKMCTLSNADLKGAITSTRDFTLLKILIFLIAACGLFKLDFGNDLRAFHHPEKVLAQGEAEVSKYCGTDNLKFKILPLNAWQEENAGLKLILEEENRGEFLTKEDLPSWATIEIDGVDYIIIPSRNGQSLSGKITYLFNKLQNETLFLLVIAYLILIVEMLILFREKFFAFFLPLSAAIISTLGIHAWIGLKINFFQLISFFVLSGLGLDYIVFHKARFSSRVVRYSFLTTLAGLGMLAFTSFGVTRSMGITFAIGITLMYFFSLPTPDSRGDGKAWYSQNEQSAGVIRMYLMWYIYRFLGKSAAKILFLPAWIFIYPFCRAGRKALKKNAANAGVNINPFKSMLYFAWSMLDKTDACTLKKNLPSITIEGDDGWTKGGAFLMSTHVGCIEVLPALQEKLLLDNLERNRIKVHAFQQLSHNSIFTDLFLRFLDKDALSLHAVEDINIATAVEMKDAIDRGEIVLMAADRVSATSQKGFKTLFFGKECVFPKGVFKFAKLMECPVYAISAVKSGWNSYKVKSVRLEGDILKSYVAYLEKIIKSHPEQWYQFYEVF